MNTSINKLVNLEDLLSSKCSLNEVEQTLKAVFKDMSQEEMIIHLAMWIHTQRMILAHKKD